MKKICVVSTSVALPEEKGLNRMFFICELLNKNGFEVHLITSDFQHWTKKYRENKTSNMDINGIHVHFLHELGYKKNIQIKRILSHYLFSKKVKKFLKHKDFDLYYSDIPDNHVTATVSKIAKKKRKPFIVDVEDLWPEAMKMIINIPLITSLPYLYFSHDAKITYKNASGVIGSSDTYRDCCDKYKIDIPYRETIYVGNNLDKFKEGNELWRDKIEKNDDEFWVVYAGTLGSSYDIMTLIKAAQNLKNIDDSIKFKILGDGPLREKFTEFASLKPCNVDFLGYLKYEQMAGYLCKSNVTVNSIVKGAAQSIVSKIGDYLAAGIPIINTCEDKEFVKKVETDGFGFNVEPNNEDELVEKILILKNDKSLCESMGKIAKSIAEKEFDRKNSYLKIVSMVNTLIGENR